MDPSTHVSARLAALGLDDRGRPTPQLMASAAVRCGLLVDLVLQGRLALTEESIELDVRPIGFPAADRLLLAMDAEPDRSLDSWFAERRIGWEQVADSLVELGRWTRRRTVFGTRYAPGDPLRREADLRLDVEDDAGWDAPTAAVASLGAMANLVGVGRTRGLSQAPAEVPSDLLAAAGEHTWVLSAALDHLRAARTAYALRASALGSGMGVGPG